MLCRVCTLEIHPGWAGDRCEDCEVAELARLNIKGNRTFAERVGAPRVYDDTPESPRRRFTLGDDSYDNE